GPFGAVPEPPTATLTEMSPEYRLRYESERAASWSAYRRDSGRVEVSWNTACPEVLAYEIAESDPSLFALAGEGFGRGGREEGTVAQFASGQIVGGAGATATS